MYENVRMVGGYSLRYYETAKNLGRLHSRRPGHSQDSYSYGSVRKLTINTIVTVNLNKGSSSRASILAAKNEKITAELATSDDHNNGPD
jgi:hypothetical protein